MILAQVTPPASPVSPASTEDPQATTELLTSATEPPTEGSQDFFAYVWGKLREAFIEMGDGAISALPNLVIAVVLLFIGLVMAKVVRSVLTSTFKKINLDSIFEKMGLTEIFSKIGLKAGPSSAIPKALYWLLLLVFVKVAADKAGIEEISTLSLIHI